MPSGASVFLEKMNVVYIGVDNPLTISGGSVGAEKVHVNFASPVLSLNTAGGDHYDCQTNYSGNGKDHCECKRKALRIPDAC